MSGLFDTVSVDFSSLKIGSFDADQDQGVYRLSPDGQSLIQSSQSWKQITGRFEVTEVTRLQFEFSAQKAGEIHGIMFSKSGEFSEATTLQFLGSQAYGIQDFRGYAAGSGTRSYDIALGKYFTGSFDRIVFLTDDDQGVGADSSWSAFSLVNPKGGAISSFDFNSLNITGFTPEQDFGAFRISADGRHLIQASQSWEQITGTFEVTATTRLKFDFSAQKAGEIHGIMFANGKNLSEATTVQLLGSQTYGIQDHRDYVAGSGTRSYDIALGQYFTGNFDRIVFLTDDDRGTGADSSWSNFSLVNTQAAADVFNFSNLDIRGFTAEQDKGDYRLSADGSSLIQASQSWEQITGAFKVTSDTRLKFDFSAQKAGEIHGIMFANGTNLSTATTIQVLGDQLYGIQNYQGYEAGSGTRSYDIALGEHFTGSFDRIIFLTDDDNGVGADSTWSNLSLTGTSTVSDPTPITLPDKEILSGRVTTLTPEGENIASVKILSQPDHGNLTVNPDKSLALVMTGSAYAGPLKISYEVTDTSGVKTVFTQDMTVAAGPIPKGWGLGDFYMLETDAAGQVVVEWGDNHRDVYVSGADGALSRADIAAREGISVDDVTGYWLRDHPQYGATADLALTDDAARLLWHVLMSDAAKTPASHWLRLEAGYDYSMGYLLRAGMQGESALHPIHITSYGEGDKPYLKDHIYVVAEGAKHLVFSNVEFGAGMLLNPSINVMMDNITSSAKTGGTLVLQGVKGFSLRNSEIYDVYRAETKTGTSWDQRDDRISGIFSAHSEHLLIENTLFDHNGWADGYTTDLGSSPAQPPSIYNHNVYLSVSLDDVTFRDNISMRAASFGAQFRSGAFIEDNVFLDNNGAGYVAGGINHGVYGGNYSLLSGNLITSGSHRAYGGPNGQKGGGFGNYAPLTTLVDNIVAHLSDPDNPAEQEARNQNNHAGVIDTNHALYNDTIVYKWNGYWDKHKLPDQNTDGLDPNVLDKTTIQRFAAQLLGKDKATISDLATYLRASAEGALDGQSDAELILAFFRKGFGLKADIRSQAETLQFVPDDKGEGVRWDNRLNWSSEDLPGTVKGDSVALGDNWVKFNGNAEIKDLSLGARGQLDISGGRLDVTGQLVSHHSGAAINLTNSGQLWVNGDSGAGRLDVTVKDGRFANTGVINDKIALDISGGQALLATEGARFDLVSGSRIEIRGGDANVGFDGTVGGTAVLRLKSGSTLAFDADDGELGQIAEFRSGSNGAAASDVSSGIHLGDATLELDLAGLGSGASKTVLMSADEIIGGFSKINVSGLSAWQDANLVIDYDTDTVALHLSSQFAGRGNFQLSFAGNQWDARADWTVWSALNTGQSWPSNDVVPDVVTVNGSIVTDFL